MKQIVLIFLCVLSLQTTGQTDLSAFQPYNTQGDNIIHVTTADFDAVGAKDYVVTMTVDGKVIAFNRPSEIATPSADNRLWEYTNLPSIGIRILAEDLIPDSLGDEILLPGTDGHIRILSSAGTLLIDKKISSGVLYSTAVGKNNKGETMLIVSGVDGLIHFLDTSGDLITTVRPKTDRTGKIAGLIRHLIVGDFDGDGGDEVAAFINRKSFEGNNFMDIIDLSTFKRPNYWNGETGEISDNTTPGLGFTDKQLGYSYDMDNDGDEEIVAHWGVYHPEDGVGTKTFSTMIKEEEKLTLQKYEGFAQQYLIDNHGFKQKDKEKLTNTGKYLMQYGLPGDFNNDGKAELFTLYGDDLFLSKYTAETQELAISEYTWAHSEYHFPGIARLEDRNGGGDKVVLAGPINGDDHFYIVDVAKPDWRIQARKINGKGVLGDVAQNIDQLTIDIDGTTTNDEIGDDKILYVGSSFNGWLGWEMTEENCQIKAQNTYDAMQEWYTKIGGSSRVRLVSSLNTTIYGETSQDENAKITKEGVIAYAKALAKKGVYFNVIIGHGNHLYMTPETFAAIYEASIIDGECYMSARTKEIRTKEYFDYYIPLLDAVIEKSEQLGTPPPMVMICAKGPVITALTQEQGDNYFPKYKDVLVPGVENSNVGTQGLSIQERVGLWMNGDVKNWGCNVIGDNLTPNRVTEYGGMRNPHVVLRHLLSQYSLGAKIFRITSVTNLGNPMYQRGDVTGEEQVWSGVYEKGVLNFLKIVEKGIYPHATKPSEVKGISPVAISLYNRSDRMLENSINHDHEFYTPVLNEYVLNKMACWDAYTDVPENDVTFFTGGAKRRFDNLLPISKGGFVTFIPHETAEEVEENIWCNVAYQTNGDTWSDFSLSQGRTTIVDALASEQSNLDFYVEGDCFWQTLQKEDDPLTYYLVVMGNSILSPKDRVVTIKAGNSISGACDIKDQLSNTSVGTLYTSESELSVTIPKGVPRIFKITLTSPSKPDFVENGDFEAKLINWTPTETVLATEEAYYGNYAAKVTGKGSLHQWRKVKPNTTYTLTAFAKVTDPENGQPTLTIKDQTDNLLGSEQVNETTYTSQRIKFTTNTTTDSISIKYLRDNDKAVGDAYLDEVVVKETAYILNADFEKDLMGWTYYGGAKVVAYEDFSKDKSVKIEGNGGISQWIKVEPSATYEVSFTTKMDDISNDLQFQINDAEGNKYVLEGVTTLQSKEYSFSVTVKDGEENLELSFSRANESSGNVWIDNITITLGDDSSDGQDNIINDLSTAILETNIYPNPANESVNIVPKVAGKYELNVFDAQGRNMDKRSFTDRFKLPVSNYTKGVYFFILSDMEGGQESFKVMVK